MQFLCCETEVKYSTTGFNEKKALFSKKQLFESKKFFNTNTMQQANNGSYYNIKDFDIIEELAASPTGSVYVAKWKRKDESLVVRWEQIHNFIILNCAIRY